LSPQPLSGGLWGARCERSPVLGKGVSPVSLRFAGLHGAYSDGRGQ